MTMTTTRSIALYIYAMTWHSLDGRHAVDCGHFESESPFDDIITYGHSAIDAAHDRLLAECQDDDERAAVLDGHMTVDVIGQRMARTAIVRHQPILAGGAA